MGLLTVMNTAVSGLSAATTIVEVTADNLANSQTPGFKSSRVELATSIPLAAIGSGVSVVGITRDFSQGPIVASDELPLLALEGDGLFILRTSGGERLYTRDGQFRLNANGDLVTAQGDHVLGFGIDNLGQIDRSHLRPLSIRLGSMAAGQAGGAATFQSYSISRNGALVGRYSDGSSRALGQLRLARFANPSGLAGRAGNKFAATPASGLPTETDPGDAGAAEVAGGATELSNVDMAHELIELTLAGNMFQANLAVFDTANTLLGELFFPYRR